jgi:hypothetical protein
MRELNCLLSHGTLLVYIMYLRILRSQLLAA